MQKAHVRRGLCKTVCPKSNPSVTVGRIIRGLKLQSYFKPWTCFLLASPCPTSSSFEFLHVSSSCRYEPTLGVVSAYLFRLSCVPLGGTFWGSSTSLLPTFALSLINPSRGADTFVSGLSRLECVISNYLFKLTPNKFSAEKNWNSVAFYSA